MGITGSKSDWLSQYAEMHSNGGFAPKEEINEVKSRVIQENRDGKLGSILEDKPFTEKKLEDDEEYKQLMKKGVTPMSAPSGNLVYLDFQYGGTSSTI